MTYTFPIEVYMLVFTTQHKQYQKIKCQFNVHMYLLAAANDVLAYFTPAACILRAGMYVHIPTKHNITT